MENLDLFVYALTIEVEGAEHGFQFYSNIPRDTNGINDMNAALENYFMRVPDGEIPTVEGFADYVHSKNMGHFVLTLEHGLELIGVALDAYLNGVFKKDKDALMQFIYKNHQILKESTNESTDISG